jgi:Kef-type K+ transport system membrane component KefB
MLAALQTPSGIVLEFLVLFGVILVGPIVFARFGLPGLVGLLLGGFAIGPHGLALIEAGDQTVPALGKFGLLYLMFVAGLELDLHLLKVYKGRRSRWACSHLPCPSASASRSDLRSGGRSLPPLCSGR